MVTFSKHLRLREHIRLQVILFAEQTNITLFRLTYTGKDMAKGRGFPSTTDDKINVCSEANTLNQKPFMTFCVCPVILKARTNLDRVAATKRSW